MRLRNPGRDNAYRRTVSDWIKANGLDPADIPISSPIVVEEGNLTVDRLVLRDGRTVPDANSPYGRLAETVTVPVVVPLPEALR